MPPAAKQMRTPRSVHHTAATAATAFTVKDLTGKNRTALPNTPDQQLSRPQKAASHL